MIMNKMIQIGETVCVDNSNYFPGSRKGAVEIKFIHYSG